MSLTPAFQIGLWNAWIFSAFMLLSMIIPDFFMSEEARKRTKRAQQFVPFKKKINKVLALSTHVVIMPLAIIYSIFLPLKTGTAWFYTGLVIFIAAMVVSYLTTLCFIRTPMDKPFTDGIYRISRHPVYLSGFLFYLSMAIASVSWIMLLFAVLWILFFHIVVRDEESHLINLYGEAYRSYMDRTPKWIGLPKPVV